MKKTERFDDILNACLDRMLKGDTIEQCLNSHPSYARELEPLLRTAAVAKRASEIQPRAEFKARARYEFQSAIKEMQVKKTHHHWFSVWQWQWHPRLAMALVAVFLIVAAGGGTVAAASDSMPESALYPVKLTTEKVQMALTFSTVGKAELNARFANERVTEIIYAASRGDTRNVLAVAGRLNNNLQNISNLIIGESASASVPAAASGNALSAASSSAQGPVSSQPVPSLTAAATAETAPLLKRSSSLAAPLITYPQPGATNVPVNPIFTWPQVDSAAGYDFQLADNPQFVNPIESVTNLTTNSYALTLNLDSSSIYFWRYRSLNSDGAKADWVQNGFTTGTEFTADTPVPSLPPAALAVPQTTNPVKGKKLTDIEKLTQQIAQYANANSAHLQAALDKSPPDVKPALKQAISKTSAEYNKLIQQLDKASKEK